MSGLVPDRGGAMTETYTTPDVPETMIGARVITIAPGSRNLYGPYTLAEIRDGQTFVFTDGDGEVAHNIGESGWTLVVLESPKFTPQWTLAPGEHVLEAMQAAGMDKVDAAKALGLDTAEMGMLLVGTRAITANLADRLERVFGRPAHYWLALEANHRADVLRLHKKARGE